MSTSFTVSLTDTQKKTMDYWMEDIQSFLDNITNENIRRASDEIVAKLVDHCNANEIQLATGKEAQITQAFTLGVVTTATIRNAEEEANLPV